MKAILSDVHGNLEALQAVLADIARHGADAIYCLGDVVGFGGPNPRECVDLAMGWHICLMGNHERAVFVEPDGYGPTAHRAMLWAARELHAPVPDRSASECRLAFLERLPQRHEEGDFLFVHGTAHNPLHEYVFPEDVYNERKLGRVFAAVGRYCFQSHTHVPGVFTEDRCCFAPEEFGGVYHLDGRKTLVNVGSVGQPRDGDWRACYVLLDGHTITFRRVEYDVDTTVRKMQAIAELDHFLWDRLHEGQ
jgi:diadenosine tetraphosphatase ApaH/serine/threonine PP2A family protein phosphatase